MATYFRLSYAEKELISHYKRKGLNAEEIVREMNRHKTTKYHVN